MNEHCWILIGAFKEEEDAWLVQPVRQVVGQPASVEADWAWTLAREEATGDVAGFAHTHPIGAGTVPSGRDQRTMQAWCTALGKPLLCLIDEGDSLNNPSAYVFEDDQSEGVPITNYQILESRL